MAEKQKILITGSNGQLGSELKELSPVYSAYEFIFLTRNELPLNEIEIIKQTIASHQPDYVINCAAYTAVDKAETDREEAFKVNAVSVGILAEACADYGAKLVHISTDYVFDGSYQFPLKEEHPVQPVNVYGESKLAGEQAALKSNPSSIIIRTSWVYSYYGKNFVKTMLRLMAEKETLNVVSDQWGSPTYAADLAEAILQIITTGNWVPGIYHYSNEGVITWFDFAKEIGSLIETSCNIQPTTTDNFPTPARRPLYSVMDKKKITEKLGIVIKPWKHSLAACIQKLQKIDA
jgi:dTDP-4-dehydrorhamnose reductase